MGCRKERPYFLGFQNFKKAVEKNARNLGSKNAGIGSSVHILPNFLFKRTCFSTLIAEAGVSNLNLSEGHILTEKELAGCN